MDGGEGRAGQSDAFPVACARPRCIPLLGVAVDMCRYFGKSAVWLMTHLGDKQTNKKIDRTTRETHADIGHSAPTHRGGHVQNRRRQGQALRGKIIPGP